MQNGNSFGATAVLGTNDAYGLTLEVGGVSALQIADEGAITVQNETDSTTAFQILDIEDSSVVFNVDTTNERVGIGTATPDTLLDISSSGTPTITLQSTDNVVATGTDISQMNFGDAYGTSAQILVERGTVGGGGDIPGTISFWTVPDGSTTLTRRLQIDHQGRVTLTGSTDNLVLMESGTDIRYENAGVNYITAADAAGEIRVRTGGFNDRLTVDANGLVGIGESSPDARLEVAGGHSRGAWGFNGVQIQAVSATYTDTSTGGSGTATNTVINSFGTPSLDANGAGVTFTNTATVYVQGAPTLDGGSDDSITNAYALWVDGGTTRLDGDLIVQGNSSHTFTTPNSSGVTAYASVNVVSPGSTAQVLALGIDSSSHSSARVISVFDDRAGVNNTPPLAVFSPDESTIIGLGFDGINSQGNLKTLAGTDIGFKIDAHTLGLFDATDGSFLLDNISDSTTAFQVIEADAGGVIFNVDTSNERVGINTNAPVDELEVSSASGAGVSISRDDTTVTSGEVIGTLDFYNNDADLTTNNVYGRIQVEAGQNITTDAAIGTLSFWSPNASNTLQKKVSIPGDSTGGLRVHKAGSDTNYANFNVSDQGTLDGDLQLTVANGATTNYFLFANEGLLGINATNSTFVPTSSIEVVQNGSYDYFRASSSTSGAGDVFVVDNNGDVGIGDGTPDAKLDVTVDSTAVTSTRFAQLLVNNATNTDTDGINKYGLYISSTGSFTGSTGAATTNYGLFVAEPTGADNNYAAIFNGDVGIGTISPSDLLHITSSGDAARTRLRLEVTGNNSNQDALITFSDPDEGGDAYSIGLDDTSDRFVISASAELGTTDRLVIDSSGNVGIGTSTPDAILEIDGDRTLNAWTWNGPQLQIQAGTFTDDSTAASGTAAQAHFNTFQQATLAATNASVTTTDAATIWIEGAPIAGANQTITNAYALLVDSGNVRIDDDLNVSGNVTLGSDANDTITIWGEAGTANGDVVFGDTSFQNCVLTTDGSGILDCSPSGTLITLQSAYEGGNTVSTSTAEGDLDITLGDATNFIVDINGTGSLIVQDGNNNVFEIPDGGGINLGYGAATTQTIDVTTRTTNAIGAGLTISAGDAGTGASAFAGGQLLLQGGAAGGTGNANGGNVVLEGGAGTGTGTQGLVVIENAAVNSVTNATCGTDCTVTQANVDGYSSIIVEATAAELEIIMPDPTITTAGRLIYVTAADGTNDFTLTLNDAEANEVNISLRENETATLIWNGSDWTAAGASSSTTLQSAYNNTLTSAGGAEILLNAPGGSADGFTIRNNDTTPITGGLLEVQASIGNNLFAVNNYGTEFAANGGAEDNTNFSTDWTAVGSASRSRTTTSGQYATGQAAVSVTTTALANDGVRNNLDTALSASTTYLVSFTGKLASGTFTTLDVQYSRDGGTDLEACTNYSTQTLVTGDWTKITCDITTDGTAPTNSDLIIRQTDATARTFYIDNLSIRENESTSAPPNVQIGGGQLGGAVTLFTLDQSASPPVASGDSTYYGSMYYDTTTGRIQCYEADGWGACGSPPNNIITLTPEYAGSVLNGTGVGTMTADFCSDQSGVLQVNSTLCDTGEAVNYYEWTSPQATSQTYSIYLTFQLPNTFDQFFDNNTITLDARTTDTADASVTYEVFRSTGSAITECGSDTTVTSSNNTWQTVSHSGNEQSGCSFAGGDRVIFKLNMTARNNDSVYVSDINFTYTNE
ncbi:MAG: carbohydrate binding domain-containing protein [Candidatus Saccharimonadales bacterium]|nr:carbohydrate binding domain-containing protein [Candidatus Saccharimonadales bacterium]